MIVSGVSTRQSQTRPRRIAIVGSRDYPRRDQVIAFVRSLPRDTVIISGGARGVDTWAAEEACARGMNVVEIFPDWDRHGKSAGLIRNGQIVDQCDELVAFWDGTSRGTKNSIDRARHAGKPVRVFTP